MLSQRSWTEPRTPKRHCHLPKERMPAGVPDSRRTGIRGDNREADWVNERQDRRQRKSFTPHGSRKWRLTITQCHILDAARRRDSVQSVRENPSPVEEI